MRNTALDRTHDLKRRSWVASANAHLVFPIQNLPLGIYSYGNETIRRFGVAIGDEIIDVTAALNAGLLNGDAAQAARLVQGGSLNALLASGPALRKALRHAIGDLLDVACEAGQRAASLAHALIRSQAECRIHLPVEIGNYTDFFAGIHHVRAAGAILRPEDPLPENYKYLPLAYHGRASSIRPSGEEIRRPHGQFSSGLGVTPCFAYSEQLDFELELGCYVGTGNELGSPIPISEARTQITGLCLLNDWSARDIQRWEMKPLGPFLGKSFHTTVSPWIVTAEALAPFGAPMQSRLEGDPPLLGYLHDQEDQESGAFDIELTVMIRTARMRAMAERPAKIVTSNARYLYWTLAQMIAHHTVNGCNLQPGDLLGTGTISGPTHKELGSLLELTRGGAEAVILPNGEQRIFLEDGDEIMLSACCQREGFATIGFGSCSGLVVT